MKTTCGRHDSNLHLGGSFEIKINRTGFSLRYLLSRINYIKCHKSVLILGALLFLFDTNPVVQFGFHPSGLFHFVLFCFVLFFCATSTISREPRNCAKWENYSSRPLRKFFFFRYFFLISIHANFRSLIFDQRILIASDNFSLFLTVNDLLID